MKKRLKVFIAAAVMLFASVAAPISASAAESARYELPFETSAESYLLVSLDTGEVIFEKNAH
ncbi:MAG: hypothetical protein IJW74_07020, partial [Oscillospiraceae bacterium]|nr:hypothetical protein [Oscillospiraceae bacterium]